MTGKVLVKFRKFTRDKVEDERNYNEEYLRTVSSQFFAIYLSPVSFSFHGSSPFSIQLLKLVGMEGLWLLPWLGLVAAMPCEEARMRCAFRTGCGNALNKYMMACSELSRRPNVCPELCVNALIALMSTNEGKQLTICDCGGDEMCKGTKERVEVCRARVDDASNNATVTCQVAQAICGADGPCSNALKYYHMYCHSMFVGKRCSLRCKNSIDILRRQEKAGKLDTCICSGEEEYDCLSIRKNMKRLCDKKPEDGKPKENQVLPRSPSTGFIIKPSLIFIFIPSLNALR